MEATFIINPNGTFKYVFENYSSVQVVKKSSKRYYKFMLIGFARKSKGAWCDGSDWCFIGLGNNPKSMVSSWKSLYRCYDLRVIPIFRNI